MCVLHHAKCSCMQHDHGLHDEHFAGRVPQAHAGCFHTIRLSMYAVHPEGAGARSRPAARPGTVVRTCEPHFKLTYCDRACTNTLCSNMLTRLEWADCAQRVTERLKAGPADQGFAYVAIGLAASAFLTFPVAVQLLKPRKPQSLEPVAVPKDIESSLVIQVRAQ